MKTLFGICMLLILAGGMVTCKKLRKLKEFDLNYTQDITIPANNTVLTLPFDITTPQTTTNTKGDYDKQGTSAKLVDEVTLSKLIFTVKSPSSGNFDFLNSVEIYISSPNNSEALIAFKHDIPETGLQQLDLDVNSTNLKNYLQDDSYSLRVKTVTDKAISTDMVIRTDETFHVKAKLKNLFK